MQTDHLHYLLEIARQGSINKAAEALHLPRTHLSRVLAGIESDLGVTLFERLPRGVRPTTEGNYVLARTEEALSILDEMVAHFREQPQNVFPSFKDRVTFYCPSHMRSRGQVSAIIENWQDRFPNARIVQKAQKLDTLAELLLANKNALALVLQSPGLDTIDWRAHEKLRFIPTAQSRIVALVAENHPLATVKSVSLKTLCSERLILISQADDEPPAFYHLLSRYGTPNVKQVITGNVHLFQEMIASGRYVSLGTASQYVKDGLKEIPLKEKIIVTGGLLFNPAAMESFPLRTLAEMVLAAYGKEAVLLNG